MPARAICASCAEVTPLTKIGTPTSSGVMPWTANKRSPAPPATASSSALVGRRKFTEVVALPLAVAWLAGATADLRALFRSKFLRQGLLIAAHSAI